MSACASSRAARSVSRSAAKERNGSGDARLVALAEIAEAGKRLLRILAVLEFESVEAAAFHVQEVIADHVSDGAQLPLVAVTLAQQARDRKAAPVAELGKVHLDAL